MNIEDKIKIGQLISLEWKLGVAIKSKDSPELNTPFVTIFMKTADSNNIKSSHCFELNLQEFKVLKTFSSVIYFSSFNLYFQYRILQRA